jgi:hypothetical protein
MGAVPEPVRLRLATADKGRAAYVQKKCPDDGALMVVLSYYFRKQFED